MNLGHVKILLVLEQRMTPAFALWLLVAQN